MPLVRKEDQQHASQDIRDPSADNDGSSHEVIWNLPGVLSHPKQIHLGTNIMSLDIIHRVVFI
jgi:hypothetical protein